MRSNQHGKYKEITPQAADDTSSDTVIEDHKDDITSKNGTTIPQLDDVDDSLDDLEENDGTNYANFSAWVSWKMTLFFLELRSIMKSIFTRKTYVDVIKWDLTTLSFIQIADTNKVTSNNVHSKVVYCSFHLCDFVIHTILCWLPLP